MAPYAKQHVQGLFVVPSLQAVKNPSALNDLGSTLKLFQFDEDFAAVLDAGECEFAYGVHSFFLVFKSAIQLKFKVALLSLISLTIQLQQ